MAGPEGKAKQPFLDRLLDRFTMWQTRRMLHAADELALKHGAQAEACPNCGHGNVVFPDAETTMCAKCQQFYTRKVAQQGG